MIDEYQLRHALFTDEDASQRAAAADALAQIGARNVKLGDALYDSHPSVRMATCRAIARLGDRTALPLLRRLALEEPIWWARRAAVRAVARLDRKDAIDLLRAVLDDPFWRVRHAAVRALLALGGAAETDAAIVEAIDGSERADGALRYLARRLGRLGHQGGAAPLSPPPIGQVADPDPAVITARLERGDAATPAELALYIGDPHAALRAAASKRLRRLAEAGETRAILAASWWLEEPRIPHATASVVKLLDAVASDDLLDALLADPDARPGAAACAVSSIDLHRRPSLLDDVSRALTAAAPIVRRAATAALRAFPQRLRAMLDDPDEDVRRLAVDGLVNARDPAVLELPFAEQPALVRRLLVRIAGVETLRLATRDEDPETRARALRALHAGGLLDAASREEARASEDPWVRGAVLDPLEALRDIDPNVRRAAFSGTLAAARIACDDADPWLRLRAAERLARSHAEEDRARVLRLSRDRDANVRAAVADERRLRLRAEELMAEARAAGKSASIVVEPASPVAPAPIASARPLGRTGILISPLVLSGANEPSVASLFRAQSDGCNAFFWEPRYRNLTTFLRTAAARGQKPLVVAGTYHATERAIRADVERTLRRLGRDQLDVFLVFWTRSPTRLEDRTLQALKREGLIRAVGFSTHDRALASAAMDGDAFDVLMVRHSAAHPGAEEGLFSRAQERGVGVLGFSATSYGRLVGPATASECYRYSLSQRGVTACVSAPRGGAELIANLEVLREPHLDEERMRELRVHGQQVREDSLEFGRHIRRFPTVPDAERGEDLDLYLETPRARSCES